MFPLVNFVLSALLWLFGIGGDPAALQTVQQQSTCKYWAAQGFSAQPPYCRGEAGNWIYLNGEWLRR